jgi:hypothetical protein
MIHPENLKEKTGDGGLDDKTKECLGLGKIMNPLATLTLHPT